MKADFPNLLRYASENEKLLQIPNEGNRIVFFGDSIIEFWTARNSTLFRNPNHINRGISGQVTAQMWLRFPHDVVELQPSTVVILAGINDIAENNGPIAITSIFQNLVAMSEIALNQYIKVILCSVLPASSISWRNAIDPSEKIVRLNAMLESFAKSNSISYIDYYSQMADENKGLNTMYSDDGVHPNAKGYAKMEEISIPFLN